MSLPSRGSIKLYKFSTEEGTVEIDEDTPESILQEVGQTRYVWEEQSFILRLPRKMYYLEGDHMVKSQPAFRVFVHAVPFFIFLLIGASFGVFFRKSKTMDLRAAVYSAIVGLMILFIISGST